MPDTTFNVLVLCTGNSARSVMAEALFNVLGKGRFHAYSAGSHPAGAVNAFAIERCQSIGYDTSGLRSKSWDEFALPDAPRMDFVITVCDQAAGEACPVWPGQPLSAHWGLPDPAVVEGSDEVKSKAFRDAFVTMKRRIELMLALPLAKLDKLAIQKEIKDIGTRWREPVGETTNVLILCTHNSARSVLAEGMLNHWAARLGTTIQAFSAGSSPSGRINPHALKALNDAGVDTSDYRSKSWDEFARPDAPQMRIVITVCDQAAAEPCPYWPGSPVQVHWGYADPSNAPEEQKPQAFELTRQAIGYRMLQLAQVPLDMLTNAELQSVLGMIERQ
jgi:arsenate reductase